MLDRPERIALLVSLLMLPVIWGGFYLLFWLPTLTGPELAEPQAQHIPYIQISLVALLISTLTGFLIEFLVRRFLYARLLRIYKTISNPEKYRGAVMVDAEEIGKVEMEVASWARKTNTEVNTLRQRDDIRRDFIANLSHELKTPIFNIQSYILTLRDGVKEKKTREKFLKKANRNVERMIRLIRDMDVLAHLESGELELHMDEFDLRDYIEDALEQMEDRIQQGQLTVKIDIDPELDTKVYADPERMDQVLLNLISNAVKYSSEEDPEMTIRLVPGERVINVMVSDNGIGISKEDMARIFERFFRADRSRSHTKKVSGTGLGLAICKHIVEAHGQSIKVTSEIGHGTTFSYSIAKPEAL